MSEFATIHHTIVIERICRASHGRVWEAWTSSHALARWYLPGTANWWSRVDMHEFRVGGAKRLSFGPTGGETYTEDCRYEDILEGERLCYSMTIAREGERLTTSMVTVEIAARGANETALRVTDQLAILDGGHAAADRERGWGETLDNLATELT
jgi:uncharacterized protein YndB with AHSA1/START domain